MYLPVQYNSPDQAHFFFFKYTIHNIPGSQYLEYLDPGNLLLLYSFVLAGSHVGDATPQKYEHGLYGPVLSPWL